MPPRAFDLASQSSSAPGLVQPIGEIAAEGTMPLLPEAFDVAAHPAVPPTPIQATDMTPVDVAALDPQPLASKALAVSDDLSVQLVGPDSVLAAVADSVEPPQDFGTPHR